MNTQINHSNVTEISVRGHELINNPLLNKSTAFTFAERDSFGLHALLPAQIETLDDQINRRLACVRAMASDLDRYVFLRQLQDTNETLYFALISRHLEELLPVIYTPTVGAACQRYSRIFRRPRGLYLSWETRHKMDSILADPYFDQVECIVVTDGERILGLGDQGAGGMGIPIGKLAIYSACGGIDPATTLAITLDVGTNNEDLLDDPMYIGWRHKRIFGDEYDYFIDLFVSAVRKRWPNVLLQWEDFHKKNANRILERYRHQLCSFNDDIQGTAAVTTGTLLAAANKTKIPISEHRIAIFGGGSAGIGIAKMLKHAMIEQGLSEEEAQSRFYVVDRHGLITDATPNIDTFQKNFAQKNNSLKNWIRENSYYISLFDVVRNAHPTVLIGVSGQANAFSEQVIREMARHVKNPIVFPLSNPTSCAEALPADIIRWTDGYAIVSSGSPFSSLEYKGHTYHFAQTNNSYIFPGVGLAALAVKARHISDKMFLAAAKTLAALSPACNCTDRELLPALSDMRKVSFEIALAVAKQARDEGLTRQLTDDEIVSHIRSKMWEPTYRTFVCDKQSKSKTTIR